MKHLIPAVPLFLLLAGLNTAHAGGFQVSSPTFRSGHSLPTAHVFNGFGCSGDNRSPELHWTDAPAGTRSFAVTVYDPDAPTGSGWWHWVAYDIPAATEGLPANAGTADGAGLPAGTVQARTDFGKPGFGGACPPAGAGKHRYILTVHALKVDTLAAPADASPALIGYLIHMNRLGSAVLKAGYGR